ncbi:cation efflux family-domain-containing protein [Myxozyma melibiosi]|uniref:Zinc transporter n=1 Tax=Myxozyma melibiosi TaxID=54550 RepID=A0ABR1FD55_9ASCO
MSESGHSHSHSQSHSHSHSTPARGHGRLLERTETSTKISIATSPLLRSSSTFGGGEKPASGDVSAIDISSLSSLLRQPVLFVQTLLAHSDTRSIFLFLVLNFTFMLIQFLYSLLSHSLGLLSDSIHMLLDCLALLVGLLASVMSKWPPSASFPYGLGKVESLSGFVNGILLVGISLGIVVEALERIFRPVEIERVTELLVVSFLGLVVNLVGIMAFNHGHAGHGHSHSHSHSHSAANEHDHSHSGGQSDRSKRYSLTDLSDPNVSPPQTPSHADGEQEAHSSHSDDEDCQKKGGLQHNENMHGLFLHILADTLGSVGVIVSTLLTSYFGWAGFDPLASLFIAALIFGSAIPLVMSSANSLLISLTPEQEYHLRNALNDVLSIPGVVEYSKPRFWPVGESAAMKGGIRGAIHVRITNEADPVVVRQKVEERICGSIAGASNLFIQVERASVVNGLAAAPM